MLNYIKSTLIDGIYNLFIINLTNSKFNLISHFISIKPNTNA
jgi:hypothetical protein